MPRISKKKILVQTKKGFFILKPFVVIGQRIQSFKSRRPHHSFLLTRRRDYARSLKLPGYIVFTQSVNKTIWQHKKVFIWLAVIYGALSTILIGIGSQDTYSALTSTLQETGSQVFQGNLGELGKAGLLFVSIASSGLTATPTEGQQIYTVLIGLLIWLTTIWLLRNLMAGHKVKMRDGLYSAGAPIISTFLVSLLMVIQLIPLGIAVIAYSAASTTGLLDGGVAAMLFWIAAILLGIMSLYLITSTFFAMIIVTLPGMYPMKAIRTAGDMVIGRRLRILLRISWMFLCVIVTWAVILIPFILLDSGLKHVWTQIEGVPIIPMVLLALGTFSFIWTASYVYLLYRRVVDDDAKPA